jgi:DNA-binding response OmpR family regulator
VNSQPKPTLLMVEDEEITSTMLKFLLERSGYHVVHAADGQQALDRIDRMPPPALVLLDVMLPYWNGLQILAHLRSKPNWQEVPVIMLTSDSSEHDIRQALDTGANDYMVKPFNPRELTARLHRFIKTAA